MAWSETTLCSTKPPIATHESAVQNGHTQARGATQPTRVSHQVPETARHAEHCAGLDRCRRLAGRPGAPFFVGRQPTCAWGRVCGLGSAWVRGQTEPSTGTTRGAPKKMKENEQAHSHGHEHAGKQANVSTESSCNATTTLNKHGCSRAALRLMAA